MIAQVSITVSGLSQVSITVSDLRRGEVFYDAVMMSSGHPCVYKTEQAIGYGTRS